MVFESRQLKYSRTEKGKRKIRNYCNNPINKERKRLYDQTNKERRNETQTLRYYYKTDPTPCIRSLFIETKKSKDVKMR